MNGVNGANKAAVLHGPYDVKIENWPMPEINDNEVLIKVACVGICGSDVKLWSTGKCGFDVLSEPIVIGHEGAGTVVKVGSKVSSLSVGDRVAIEPTQPCRACGLCRAGRYNLCPRPHYCSSLGADGNLATYYKHVPDYCHKMPPHLSMEEGAAVQPLAIAIHACNRAGVRLGARVAVFGAGPVGVLCAMAARAMGANKILMTDVTNSRLETAKALGADYTLLVTKELSEQQTADQITQLLGGSPDVSIDACAFPSATRTAMLVNTVTSNQSRAYTVDYLLLVSKELSEQQTADQITQLLGGSPDVSIDACAFPSATRTAMLVTATGGVVLVVGIGAGSVEVPLASTLLREVDVRGSFRIVNTYPAAISAVASGAIDLKKFITHHMPLEQTQEALKLAQSGDAMKVIIHLPE